MNENGARRRRFLTRIAQLSVAGGMAGLLYESVRADNPPTNPNSPVTTTTSVTSVSLPTAVVDSGSASGGGEVPVQANVGDLAGVLSLAPRSTDPANQTGVYQIYFFESGNTHELRIKSPSGTLTTFPTK